MKYAIILPGNLSTYFVSLINFEKLSYEHDIDIYILYSKNINYVHSFGSNININVDTEDISIINSKLKNYIKFFEAIEDIPNYDNIMNEKINIFKKNILWTKDLDVKQLDNFNYESFLNNNRTRFYLDQFVRINYLYKII